MIGIPMLARCWRMEVGVEEEKLVISFNVGSLKNA